MSSLLKDMEKVQKALEGVLSRLGPNGYIPVCGEPATTRAREALAMIPGLIARVENRDLLIQNLAMLVKRLARRLDKTEGHEELVDPAMEFLKRHDLLGSALRQPAATTKEGNPK